MYNPFIDHEIGHLNTRLPEEIKHMLFSFTWCPVTSTNWMMIC